MKVYFDRNVFDYIKRIKDASNSTPAIDNLYQAVRDGKITILLSTTLLEETLPFLKLSKNALKEELENVFSLVEKRRMIKPAEDLLREAVQSYAFGRKIPDRLTKTPRILIAFLMKGKVTHELEEFIKGTLSRKDNFLESFTDAFEEARRLGEERNIGRPDNFQEFWNGMATSIAESLAIRYELHKRCVERGIEGMIENRTIKLYSVYYAAWVFSKWFGEQGEPGQVKASDGGDFFHAVQASAADVFVTNDKKLSRWLKQVSIEGFEIMNIAQFLEQL